MRINYKGNDPQIKVAVEDANDVLREQQFYDLIAKRTSFNCTQLLPSEISRIVQDSNLKVELKFYKSRWRWSRSNGYFSGSLPDSIFLNIRRLNRSLPSISNTIVHEYIHAVDHEHNNNIIDFGHNCGTHTNTAPYEIGNIAESIVNGELEEDVEHIELLEQIDKSQIINF